jgi:hypothetical protein
VPSSGSQTDCSSLFSPAPEPDPDRLSVFFPYLSLFHIASLLSMLLAGQQKTQTSILDRVQASSGA